MHSLAKQQLVFTSGMLFSGGFEAALAYGLVGSLGVEGVVYSVLLCLVPGWLTIFVANLIRQQGMAAYAVLVGTGLRMVFVIAGLFAVRYFRPELGFREFEVWLIADYLVALALETWVLLSLSREADVSL